MVNEKKNKFFTRLVSILAIWMLVGGGLVGLGIEFKQVSAAGPTNISGLISSNTTWTTANSPYHIIGDTTLMIGRSLDIQAGTVVKFANNTKLRIRGALNVYGTNTNKVIFSNLDPIYSYSRYNKDYNLWHTGSGMNYIIYVESDNGGIVNIDHAKFEYSSNRAIYFDGYTNTGDPDIIVNSTFENNYYALGGGGGDVIIKDSTFRYNEVSVGNITKTVDSCLFQNNTFGVYFEADVYDSYFIGNYIGSAVSASVVKYCEFLENEIGVSRNPFNHISSYFYNSIHDNKIGVNFANFGTYSFQKNNIYNNSDYNLKITGPNDKVVKNNWWGTNDPTKINQSIYDIYDDISLGEAIYEPYLNSWLNTSNQPPVADAGIDQNTSVYQSILLDGSGSYDPHGDTLQYKWDFGDGASTNWQINSNANHAYSQIGNFTVNLTVSDGKFKVSDSCIIHVINQPPLADAGPDQNATKNQIVYFDGSGSYDPDGDPLTYKWDFGDGTSTGWQSYSNASHAYSQKGNFTVNLTVSDGIDKDLDSCIVQINNHAPVADAGSDQTTKVGQTVYFDGSGSYDPDADTLTYKWDFGNGYNTGWQNNCNTSYIYNNSGNYSVTLTVSDGDLTDFDICIVKVSASGFVINQEPVADAGLDQNATVGQTVYFDGSGSYDPDEDTLLYNWEFDDGTSSGWQNDWTVTHSYDIPGNYLVTLTVSDDSLTNDDTCVIYVAQISGNHAPVADAGPDQTTKVGQPVYFDGSGSYDPDEDTLTYKWDFGDEISTEWQNDWANTHSYNKPENYLVTLTVSDGLLSDKDTCIVFVADITGNHAPLADAGPDQTVKIKQTVHFDGSNSIDIDSDLLSFKWEFGDGALTNWQNDCNASHIYNEVGNFVATLFVSDGYLIDHDNCTIYVIDDDGGEKPPADNDTDGDGLPNDWELEHGFDPEDSRDALLDNDGDTLTNLDEFEHGTNPNNRDSDNDNIPDNWELDHGLNPTDATDAALDHDGDSLSNLQEFQLSTDPQDKDTDGDGYMDNIDAYPTNPNKYKEEITDNKALIETYAIILFLIIIIIIMIVMMAVLYKNKRKIGGQIYTNEKQVDERQEIRDSHITEEYQPPENYDLESDGLIKNLKQEALVPDKTQAFGLTEQEIQEKLEVKHRNGELSKTTYDSIKETIGTFNR